MMTTIGLIMWFIGLLLAIFQDFSDICLIAFVIWFVIYIWNPYDIFYN